MEHEDKIASDIAQIIRCCGCQLVASVPTDYAFGTTLHQSIRNGKYLPVFTVSIFGDVGCTVRALFLRMSFHSVPFLLTGR